MLLSKYFKTRRRRKSLGTVSINYRPVDGPYGGMNLFVRQVTRWLLHRGYQVIYELNPEVDVIFIVHAWMTHTDPYGFDETQAFKRDNPTVKVLLRVNECDKRKGTDHMDQWLARWHALADYTVFISKWLSDYHADKWFDSERPHTWVYNGADPRVFHPVGSAHYQANEPLRLVTHHWSDNPMKGYPDYVKLDNMIHSGQIRDVDFSVIGRWPEDIQWKSTKTYGPMQGKELADLLRSCHVYLTGSLYEPGGMHHVEGIQCGLPVIYHCSGGGIVELAKHYGVEYSDDLASAIGTIRANYHSYRENVLNQPPTSGDEMCLRFVDIIQRLRIS